MKEAGAGHAGIAVDILHLLRSGGPLRELSGIDPSLVAMGQLCDGPIEAPKSDAALMEEMMHGRAGLGEGEFPLTEFIARLPGSMPLGIEVLGPTRPATVEDGLAEARRLMRSAIACLEAAREAQPAS